MFVLLNNLHIQQLDEQSKVMKNDFSILSREKHLHTAGGSDTSRPL